MFKTPFCDYNLYWIGPRESDIEAVKGLFSGSITFFGDGGSDGYAQNGPESCRGNKTRSRKLKADHNDMGDVSLDKFVFESVNEIIKIYDDLGMKNKVKFLMYNANVLRPHSSKNEQKKEIDPNKPKGEYLFSQSFYNENYICINSDEIMEKMDSKISFHNIFVDILGEENMLEIQVMKGKDIDSYHQLCQKFDVDAFSGIRFIVQENFASGGAGTHIVEKPRHGERLSFNPDDDYICSILQEDNISVNAHLIVYDDEILILPASIQIICENNKRLMYRGADFIAYEQISYDLRRRFEELCVTAASKYQQQGFRGILGLDAIIHEGKVKMLECNNRFQSSSNLLNYALYDNSLPSLQEMCYLAWSDKQGYKRIFANEQFAKMVVSEVTYGEIPYKALRFKVNYSNFNFVDSGSNIVHARRMYAIAEYFTTGEDKNNYYGYTLSRENGKANSHIFKLEKDGYQLSDTNKAFAHLFRISFDTNICAVSPEGTMRINDNIREADRAWSDKIYDFDPLATKISLLVQGVVIDKGEDTRALIEKMGGFREATNEAIDLNLRTPINLVAPSYTALVVNSPLNIKFAPLSPFSLKAEGDFLALYYYNKKINDNVEIFPQDPLSDKKTKSGTPYHDVAFLSGDRLRVHATSACCYKTCDGDKGCKFCNMPLGKKDISEQDIEEVVSAYLELASNETNKHKYKLDHFLVGGQSVDPKEDEECQKVISVIKTIRRLANNKRIYVMATPPKHQRGRDVIVKMVKAGAREFSFNMEIFNVNFAKKYMPGKANDFTRESYINALNTARFVLDDSEKESVRTMFVVGLEPITSLKQGVKLMINNNIQPMLSVFRPLPKTELENLLPPQLNQLYQLYLDIEKWCEEKEMKLGPACHYCQNNTLSLPY